MDFNSKLVAYLVKAGGNLNDIKWVTMNGRIFTLGTTSNDHLANSRHYHKHLAEVGRVSPEMNIDYGACKFNQHLMEVVIKSRMKIGLWDISEDDFRLVEEQSDEISEEQDAGQCCDNCSRAKLKDYVWTNWTV